MDALASFRINLFVTTAASDHVEDSSSSHTAANDQADDLIELCKCERGAKNVEERLEKE